MNRRTVFWSVFLIVIGILLLVKLLFHLEFNWFSAAFAVLLLESGISLLIYARSGGPHAYHFEGGTHLFMVGRIVSGADDKQVNVIFSDAQVELPAMLPEKMEINSIFSNAVVQLPAGWSARASCSCAFGSLTTPEGNLSGFGQKVFIVGEGQQCQLTLNAVFGQLVLHD